MSHIKIFIELTRLNKPIGFMLLFWPCSWGLSYAYFYNRDLDLVFYARLSFAFCCVCMIFSIFLFLQEIRLSNEALKFHLSDMDSMRKDL